MRWLHAFAPVTYLCMLPGTYALAAFLQPELFRGYTALISYLKLPVHGLHAYLRPELFRGYTALISYLRLSVNGLHAFLRPELFRECSVNFILKTASAGVACVPAT